MTLPWHLLGSVQTKTMGIINMIKWILLVVIVLAFPLETGHALAEAVTIIKSAIETVIIGYKGA